MQSILIVDRAENVEAMIRDGLLYCPILMSFSTTKSDAVKAITKYRPDLIVSGLNFTDGTALDLMKEVKTIFNFFPPGIFLTESTQGELQQEILKLGAVDVIQRPINMAALAGKIDHAVKVVKNYQIKTSVQRFVETPQKAEAEIKAEEYNLLLEESKALGMPLAELIKLKQLSN